MQVIEEYDDGSRTILFEKGDRVKLTSWGKDWIAKDGDIGTVCGSAGARNSKYPTIEPLYVQTDAMRDGKWGTIKVFPWQMELIEE